MKKHQPDIKLLLSNKAIAIFAVDDFRNKKRGKRLRANLFNAVRAFNRELRRTPASEVKLINDSGWTDIEVPRNF